MKVLDIRFLHHEKILSFLVSKMYVLFQYDNFFERSHGLKRARYTFTRFPSFHLKRHFETKESIQFIKEISGISLMFTKRSVFSATNGFSRNKIFCFYWNRSSHWKTHWNLAIEFEILSRSISTSGGKDHRPVRWRKSHWWKSRFRLWNSLATWLL